MLEQKFDELKGLSTTTAGSYFVVYFSSKGNEWTVNLNLRKIKFMDKDLITCLQKAIDYISKNRIKREDSTFILKK
jgi:hypothetical protein